MKLLGVVAWVLCIGMGTVEREETGVEEYKKVRLFVLLIIKYI